MTIEQSFLILQLRGLKVSDRWKEALIELLLHRRMIILYTKQKRQIENISKINSDEVYLLAQDIKNPSIDLDYLEKVSHEKTKLTF